MTDNNELAYFVETITSLESVSIKGYYASKLPNETDRKITELCEFFMKAGSSARTSLSALLTEKHVLFILLEYAERMAMLSVRDKSDVIVVNGLVALGMMPSRLELDRGDFMVLALLYHSAVKLGKPSELFEQAAQYAVDENAREFILHFLKRDPKDQRLDAFGYREINGPSGLVYLFGNNPIPEGLL